MSLSWRVQRNAAVVNTDGWLVRFEMRAHVSQRASPSENADSLGGGGDETAKPIQGIPSVMSAPYSLPIATKTRPFSRLLRRVFELSYGDQALIDQYLTQLLPIEFLEMLHAKNSSE